MVATLKTKHLMKDKEEIHVHEIRKYSSCTLSH